MARILVVDDSPTETHQFVNALARHGHQRCDFPILPHSGDGLSAHRVGIAGKRVEASGRHAGEIERALPIFADIFARGDNWRELTPRLVGPGFLKVDEATLERIMAAADE